MQLLWEYVCNNVSGKVCAFQMRQFKSPSWPESWFAYNVITILQRPAILHNSIFRFTYVNQLHNLIYNKKQHAEKQNPQVHQAKQNLQSCIRSVSDLIWPLLCGQNVFSPHLQVMTVLRHMNYYCLLLHYMLFDVTPQGRAH